MGLLSGSKVYLAGPIEYSTDGEGGTIWRNRITPILERIGVRVYDPMRKPPWYPKLARKSPSFYLDVILEPDNPKSSEEERAGITKRQAYDNIKFLEKACFRFAHDCEWIIAYLPREFTVGTIDELRVAANAGKPILVFCPDRVPSSWALSMLSTLEDWEETFFVSMESMLDHIRKIDNAEIPLDPLKWISISYFEEED